MKDFSRLLWPDQEDAAGEGPLSSSEVAAVRSSATTAGFVAAATARLLIPDPHGSKGAWVAGLCAAALAACAGILHYRRRRPRR